MLAGKHIVLGVTGGIAAYKACEVVSRLKKLHADVNVIMTENATKLICPRTFETLSGTPVCIDTFDRLYAKEVKHISLAEAADLFIVAPATANCMAKMAGGIADDMLTTTLLATKAPVLLAPAMNTGMWTAPATEHNHALLKDRGVYFVGPASGRLACGSSGEGRMSEPEEIVAEACAILCPVKDYAGLKVLVTAGPTRERVDPVRYLSNDSSGKMGYAIAEAAYSRGARVKLVSGPVKLAPPIGVSVVPVESTMDLYRAMMDSCEEADVVIQAAAPSDYRPETVASQKIKKQGGEGLVLHLVENPDVAKAVGERKRPDQTLVGFAAETENLLINAEKKLSAKHLDMVVANDVTAEDAGFGSDTNIACLLTEDTLIRLPMMTKRSLADEILNQILLLRK